MKKVTWKIYRYDPNEEKGSYYQDFEFSLPKNVQGLTVLDGLKKIKEEQDPSLTFRHSCGHGSCGSCGMIINGSNRLACRTHLADLWKEKENKAIQLAPLSGFPIIKDLVADLSPLYEQDVKIKPYLIQPDGLPSEELERTQKPEELETYQESCWCNLCGICTSACPTYRENKDYLGPQALTRAFRWIFDSRDKGKEPRLKVLQEEGGVWNCNKVFNCSDACPRKIDTVYAIERLQRVIMGF